MEGEEGEGKKPGWSDECWSGEIAGWDGGTDDEWRGGRTKTEGGWVYGHVWR